MVGDCWESFPYPIIIDSGACASVMPTSWCRHIPIEESEKSKAKEFFRAANGQMIFNEGQKLVTFMNKEGTLRDMSFTGCDASKALGSASQMRRTGHRVVFNPPWDPEGFNIERNETQETMGITEQNGLYVLDIRVAPRQRQTKTQPRNG